MAVDTDACLSPAVAAGMAVDMAACPGPFLGGAAAPCACGLVADVAVFASASIWGGGDEVTAAIPVWVG